MRVSVWPTNQQPFHDVVAVATHAASTGWDGVWVADHLMPSREPLEGPVVECWTTLAALAARVPDVRLGTLVTNNLLRHPGVLAKMAATVDTISGGRLVIGLGAGWQVNEHEAYGIELPAPGERLARLEEACQVVKRLLAESSVDFAGEHYRLRGAVAAPRPEHPVPLLVGAKGDRALGVVARHADEWNLWADPDMLRDRGAVLDQRCAEEGRDPATIVRSAQALLLWAPEADLNDAAPLLGQFLPSMGSSLEEVRDTVGRYAEAGLDELIVPDFTFSSSDATRDALDRFQAEVVGAVV